LAHFNIVYLLTYNRQFRLSALVLYSSVQMFVHIAKLIHRLLGPSFRLYWAKLPLQLFRRSHTLNSRHLWTTLL